MWMGKQEEEAGGAAGVIPPDIVGLCSTAGLGHLQLRATTFNCTACGQAKELLEKSGAHVVLFRSSNGPARS